MVLESLKLFATVLGIDCMYKTIMISSYIAVQGLFVRALKNGKIAIRVGDKEFVGTPVKSYSK
jgi:hypothetical protein